MSCTWTRIVAGPLAVALFVAAGPSAVASPSGARLSGVLIETDGRAAQGYTVHLIDAAGAAAASSRTGRGGRFEFEGLAAGEYGMGIENPAGQMAPVLAPPVLLSAGRDSRRDVRLVATDPQARETGASGAPAVGIWWAGLTPAAKAWMIAGAVVVLGVTVSALQSESSASPSQ
jgi:hypothetical protein